VSGGNNLRPTFVPLDHRKAVCTETARAIIEAVEGTRFGKVTVSPVGASDELDIIIERRIRVKR